MGRPESETVAVPVVREELQVERRLVETGRVRVRKVVREREVVVDEPTVRDEVTVERVRVDREVAGPVAARQEGDTLIVPLVEEVLVVERRLIVREEVHIRRRRTETRAPQVVVLRSEDVTVERVSGDVDEETTGEGSWTEQS